jgi:hypothetical protein
MSPVDWDDDDFGDKVHIGTSGIESKAHEDDGGDS